MRSVVDLEKVSDVTHESRVWINSGSQLSSHCMIPCISMYWSNLWHKSLKGGPPYPWRSTFAIIAIPTSENTRCVNAVSFDIIWISSAWARTFSYPTQAAEAFYKSFNHVSVCLKLSHIYWRSLFWQDISYAFGTTMSLWFCNIQESSEYPTFLHRLFIQPWRQYLPCVMLVVLFTPHFAILRDSMSFKLWQACTLSPINISMILVSRVPLKEFPYPVTLSYSVSLFALSHFSKTWIIFSPFISSLLLHHDLWNL